MIKHILTLTDYLLQEEQTAANAPGGLAQLLSIIEQAARVIADQLSTIGLVNLLGKTDRVEGSTSSISILLMGRQILMSTALLEPSFPSIIEMVGSTSRATSRLLAAT